MRAARQMVYCAALLGVFVIDNPQCGAYRATHAQLAIVYLRDGLYGQALAEARRAIRKQGPDARLLLVAALAHMGLDEIDAALDRLGQAIELKPNDGDLYAVLRDICLRHERFDKTGEILDRLGADHPQNAWLKAMQGWLDARQQRPEQATQALRQAIEINAHHFFARIELSRVLIDGEHFAEAETALVEALQIQPEDPQLLLALGDCQLRLNRYKQADTTFAKALATRVVDPVDIARIYYQRQQPDRAIQYYERALIRAPDDPMILNNLAWTYAEEGLHLRYALDLSIRAVKLEADSPVYLDTYAELLHLLGRHAHAIAIMGRALAFEAADGEQRIYLEGQMAKFRRALADRL